jgi:hypothetical protein
MDSAVGFDIVVNLDVVFLDFTTLDIRQRQ